MKLYHVYIKKKTGVAILLSDKNTIQGKHSKYMYM